MHSRAVQRAKQTRFRVESHLMKLLEEHNAQMVAPKWDSAGAMPINVDKHLRQAQDPAVDTYIYWSN